MRNVVLGSDLLGGRLRSEAGADLGRLEDFVLDPGGDIAYVLISTPEVRDRLFPVPWSAVRPSPTHGILFMDPRPDFIDRAPSFERIRWPEIDAAEWRETVSAYYGARRPVLVRGHKDARVERQRPSRSGISLSGAVIAALLLFAGVAFVYIVATRGWERAASDFSRSAQTVAYAMKETSQDAALTTKVKTALSLSRRVPGWNVNVDSSDGVVTLSGEVHDESVKALAEAIARDTQGVKAVTNSMTVNPTVAAESATEQMRSRVADLETRYAVHDALMRDERMRATDIRVDVNNQTVTLKGTVATPEQKAAAESLARQAGPGHPLVNQLEVQR